MKKLFALLTALLLLGSAALADSPVASYVATKTLFATLCSALDTAGIEYGQETEYDMCYFSIDLPCTTYLGSSVYYDVYAYEDGVNIITFLETEIPQEHINETIRLCNHLSSSIYLGKFYMDPYYHEICYEVFIPINPADVRDYDKELIGDYIWAMTGILDEYQDYFLEVLVNGETADNVLAMWEADNAD